MQLRWLCEASSPFEHMGGIESGCVCLFPKIWPLDDLRFDLLSHSSLYLISFSPLHHVKGQHVFPPPESIIRDHGGFSLTVLCVGWLRMWYHWGEHFSGCLHLHFKGLRRDSNDTASVQQYTWTLLFCSNKEDKMALYSTWRAKCAVNNYNRLSSYATEVFLKMNTIENEMREKRRESNRFQYHSVCLYGCKVENIAKNLC